MHIVELVMHVAVIYLCFTRSPSMTAAQTWTPEWLAVFELLPSTDCQQSKVVMDN